MSASFRLPGHVKKNELPAKGSRAAHPGQGFNRSRRLHLFRGGASCPRGFAGCGALVRRVGSMGLHPPRVILAWRGGGARLTPWPLCPSSGAGPHGRSAPEAARVPVSVPRGCCGDLEVRGRIAARLLHGTGPRGRTAPPAELAALGRIAARLLHGTGPQGCTAPQAERVRFSGPRGRCASGGAGPHGRTAPPVAHGRPALLRAGPVAARLHRVPRGTRCG
ncbi:hypothetical protein NDU88_002811 [Pleurodeles waltl]|uniref:Uncharacterized protein n=1 Tax=Pleurodeles waltl TaxID=8319 RepID=A0AAV7T3Y7_PLEWA|nr:hypothetical protein NDU88_002811 [Pleurodeles waltl]